MKLEQKYTNPLKKIKNSIEESKKEEISTDSYAICEFIEHLINKIEQMRIR